MAIYLSDLSREGVTEVWRLEIRISYDEKPTTILAAVVESVFQKGFVCSITAECKTSGGIILNKFVKTEKEAIETLKGMKYSLEIVLKPKDEEPIKFLEEEEHECRR